MLLHPLTPLLLHLIVLLLLIVVQHCFDFGIAVFAERSAFCPAILLGSELSSWMLFICCCRSVKMGRI